MRSDIINKNVRSLIRVLFSLVLCTGNWNNYLQITQEDHTQCKISFNMKGLIGVVAMSITIHACYVDDAGNDFMYDSISP